MKHIYRRTMRMVTLLLVAAFVVFLMPCTAYASASIPDEYTS